MTIQECIDASLKLLNQYSIMGVIVPDSYNDQEDDKLRMMVPLINDAVMEIATNARPIIAYTEFTVPKKDPNEPFKDLKFDMPEDFDRAVAIFFTPAFGRNQTTNEADYYKWFGDDTIAVPNLYAGTYRIEYMRFPHQYDASTPLTTEIDNTPDTHNPIPYYVAAMIANYDDQKAYYNLFNQWEIRLSRLGYKPPHATFEQVRDVYGFNVIRPWDFT